MTEREKNLSNSSKSQEVTIETQDNQKSNVEIGKIEYLGLLAGGVAHRVGSKCGLIRLYLDNLKSMIPDDSKEILAVIKKIERENNNLVELSDALFIPAHSAETPIVQIDVGEIIEQVLQLIEIPSNISFSIERNDVPFVIGNRWLVEVFYELIANAIRAMTNSEEKKLKIRIRVESDNFVAIEIEDSGCGIPAEEIPKLFDLFYTRGKDKNQLGRGGYGLWYSKSIITQLGGDIVIKSEIDKGTLVRVQIPVYG